MVGGEGGGVDEPVDAGGFLLLAEEIAGLGADFEINSLLLELLGDGAGGEVGAEDGEAGVMGDGGEGADAGAGNAGEVDVHDIIISLWVV